MAVNLNELVDKFDASQKQCFNACLNNTINLDDKSTAILDLKLLLKWPFIRNGVKDKDMGLVLQAMDKFTMGKEANSVDEFVSKQAEELYQRAYNEKTARNKPAEEKEERESSDVLGEKKPSPEENAKSEKLTKFFNLIEARVNKLIDLKPETLKEFFVKILNGAGLSEFISKPADNVVVSSANNSLLRLNISKGDGLVPKLCEHIKQKSKAQESQKEERSQTDESLEDLEHEKESFDVSKIGETSQGINFFVGYDKDAVGNLLKDKPELVEKFTGFVERYNQILNILPSIENPDQIKDIANDIDQSYQVVIAESSQYGQEGAKIRNLCRGMMTILDHACHDKIHGNDLNPHALKKNLETTHAFDINESDGISSEAQNLITENELCREHEGLEEALDDLAETTGLDSAEANDPLLPEDKEEIGLFGIEGIFTHAAWLEYKASGEFDKLLAQHGLSKPGPNHNP